MLKRKLPLEFLRRAFYETRIIREKILNLERDIIIMEESGEDETEEHEFSLPGQDISFSLPGQDISFGDNLPFSQKAYVQEIIGRHEIYAEKFVKNFGKLEAFVPMIYLMTYDALLDKLSEIAHKYGCDYPLLE